MEKYLFIKKSLKLTVLVNKYHYIDIELLEIKYLSIKLKVITILILVLHIRILFIIFQSCDPQYQLSLVDLHENSFHKKENLHLEFLLLLFPVL